YFMFCGCHCLIFFLNKFVRRLASQKPPHVQASRRDPKLVRTTASLRIGRGEHHYKTRPVDEALYVSFTSRIGLTSFLPLFYPLTDRDMPFSTDELVCVCVWRWFAGTPMADGRVAFLFQTFSAHGRPVFEFEWRGSPLLVGSLVLVRIVMYRDSARTCGGGADTKPRTTPT
ncbi:hypothetical protein BDA96_03G299700, partial [Sorghum bicolor]